MEASTTTSIWEEFFLEATIKPKLATKYATIFQENRIRPESMLADLDKQVLKEIGIVAVGDIISILRHAKEVLEQGGIKLNQPNATTKKKIILPEIDPTPSPIVVLEAVAAAEEQVAKLEDKGERGKTDLSSKTPPPPPPRREEKLVTTPTPTTSRIKILYKTPAPPTAIKKPPNPILWSEPDKTTNILLPVPEIVSNKPVVVVEQVAKLQDKSEETSKDLNSLPKPSSQPPRRDKILTTTTVRKVTRRKRSESPPSPFLKCNPLPLPKREDSLDTKKRRMRKWEDSSDSSEEEERAIKIRKLDEKRTKAKSVVVVALSPVKVKDKVKDKVKEEKKDKDSSRSRKSKKKKNKKKKTSSSKKKRNKSKSKSPARRRRRKSEDDKRPDQKKRDKHDRLNNKGPRRFNDRDISDETVTSSSSYNKLKLSSPPPLSSSRRILPSCKKVAVTATIPKSSHTTTTTTVVNIHTSDEEIQEIVQVKPNFVMIYRLNDKREWIAQGMGSVTFCKGIITCVSIDNASHVLLESEIRKDTVFENSKETFMSWTNNNDLVSASQAEEAHGLRFKESLDFHSVWSQCKGYLGGSTSKYNEEGGPRNGLSFGLASMQGWSSVMEDTHSSWITLPGRLKSCSFFSLMDGHAGSMTSTFVADNFLECLLDGDAGTGVLAKGCNSNSSEEISSILHSSHLLLDRRCRMNNAKGDVEDKSGSTSISLFLNPDLIFISNLGDSRAIICSEGRVIFATVDHKPGKESEQKRIQGAGGAVTAIGRTPRINGDLSVSRGFGDYRYKNNAGKGVMEQIVSPEPDITTFPRRAYSSDSDFIVLASDGVWDVVGNDEMAVLVQKGIDEGLELKGICNRILDICLDKESRDNMSMILVKLHKEED